MKLLRSIFVFCSISIVLGGSSLAGDEGGTLKWRGCGISKVAFMEACAKQYAKETGVEIHLSGGGCAGKAESCIDRIGDGKTGRRFSRVILVPGSRRVVVAVHQHGGERDQDRRRAYLTLVRLANPCRSHKSLPVDRLAIPIIRPCPPHAHSPPPDSWNAAQKNGFACPGSRSIAR